MDATRQIRSQPRNDLLTFFGVRRLLRWKHARLLFQIPLLIITILILWDGFDGMQRASRNLATTTVWLHYRGLVALALMLVGNLFCAACPFMLTRTLSRRIERFLPRKLTFPKRLKNKYLVLFLLFAYLFCYEFFDLWASPWLTAWVVVGYFLSALLVDTLFPAGTFCKYICPLGNFNFALASVSPTQITAVNHDICLQCVGKPCLNGRETYADADKEKAKGVATFIPLENISHGNGTGFFPGCETQLFAPTMQSNMDCTACANCIRACPYDNVTISLRSPAWEVLQRPWLRKGRLPMMVFGVLLAFWGLLNAFAMIPPYFSLANQLADTFNLYVLPKYLGEAIVLVLLFATFTVLGLALAAAFAYLADLVGQGKADMKRAFMRWGYVTVVLGFGFWAAHYLFHFLTGALSIIPVFVHFWEYQGLDVDPNWRLSRLVPLKHLFTINVIVTSIYTVLALYISGRIGWRDFKLRGLASMWVMVIYVLGFAALALWMLSLPMEMRGTVLQESLVNPSF